MGPTAKPSLLRCPAPSTGASDAPEVAAAKEAREAALARVLMAYEWRSMGMVAEPAATRREPYKI